jgi:hypothetical protein
VTEKSIEVMSLHYLVEEANERKYFYRGHYARYKIGQLGDVHVVSVKNNSKSNLLVYGTSCQYVFNFGHKVVDR